MNEPKQLHDAILEGRHVRSREITEQALAEGYDPEALIERHMIPAMDEVGRRYEAGDYFVPELLIAARAMRASLDQVRPLLAERGAQPAGCVVIGTVKGDLHDIGKNLVAALLEGAGFEVVDLGVDVPPAKFIAAVETHGASMVAMSALLTTTMASMKTTIDAFMSAGVRDRVKVMIGGAPVTEKFAAAIGADGYSSHANGAVRLARELAAT